MMSPGIRPGDLPPFHDLGEYVFQDLCRDLLDAEPDIATCEVYGERGQKQDGIDLRAYCKEGNRIVVGQCKCYQDFPPAEIRQASEDFLAHWDRWAHENVTRFVLCVACDMSNRQRQDEIDTQRKRFAALGITYELWSAATIRNKLRPHPSIVVTYCTPAEHWVQAICGGTSPPFQTVSEQGKQTATVVDTALITLLGQLTERLSNQAEHELERMRIAWREGRKSEAAAWLTALKNDTVHWQGLSPTMQAKVLCFEASLVLDHPGGVKQARALVEEAHALDPADPQVRLRALIVYKDTGSEAALTLLQGQEDVESRNLHAAILLEMGHAAECFAILDFATTP